MLAQAWRALGGDPALLELVTAHGDPGLPSPFPVGDLALGAAGWVRLHANYPAPCGGPQRAALGAASTGRGCSHLGLVPSGRAARGQPADARGSSRARSICRAGRGGALLDMPPTWCRDRERQLSWQCLT